MNEALYKLIFFAPKDCAAEVSQAMFQAGAGQIGDYESCCFSSEGTGQFRPGEGSDPYLGKKGEIEYVKELKVEMICPKSHVRQALLAMKEAHPYEEPAYDVISLANHEFPLD